MNSLLSLSVSLLVFSIISIQLTSSASFPNPPQFPPPHASAEEWTLFWKLLHNYYAIIARPRFGKRYDSIMTESEHPPLVAILKPNTVSSGNEINYMLSENNHNANDDRQINADEFYTFSNPDRKRR